MQGSFDARKDPLQLRVSQGGEKEKTSAESGGELNPNVAKVGGLQSQGAKGAAVPPWRDCKPLATRDLKSSGFPAGEKRWHKIDPILKFTVGLFL
jgi:hypothetical protein